MARRPGVLVLVIGALAGCLGEIEQTAGAPGRESRALAVPPRADFEMVADALQTTCGSLDCHGQPGRNLRLFGARGMRLAIGDTSAEGATTDVEYDASYWAVVGLEPEIMADVVRERGRDPERLSLIRKARGTDLHKGGALTRPDHPLDRCLLAWIAGALAADDCTKVTDAPRPVAEGR
jgi:hypothetical protein